MRRPVETPIPILGWGRQEFTGAVDYLRSGHPELGVPTSRFEPLSHLFRSTGPSATGTRAIIALETALQHSGSRSDRGIGNLLCPSQMYLGVSRTDHKILASSIGHYDRCRMRTSHHS